VHVAQLATPILLLVVSVHLTHAPPKAYHPSLHALQVPTSELQSLQLGSVHAVHLPPAWRYPTSQEVTQPEPSALRYFEFEQLLHLKLAGALVAELAAV